MRNQSPQLLISIRDEQEAAIAGEFAVGIVDLKHPDRGALGALDKTVVQKILSVLDDHCIKSIALGELVDWHGFPQAPRRAERSNRVSNDGIAVETDGKLLQNFHYAKVGLSKLAQVRNWQEDWLDFVRMLPSSVRPVGVCYMDVESEDCPSVESILELLADVSTGALLLDTTNKSVGSLLSLVGQHRLRHISDRARQQQTEIAIAGSLTKEDLTDVLKCQPDYIGVRGAICRSGRSKLDSRRLGEFLKEFSRLANADRSDNETKI